MAFTSEDALSKRAALFPRKWWSLHREHINATDTFTIPETSIGAEFLLTTLDVSVEGIRTHVLDWNKPVLVLSPCNSVPHVHDVGHGGRCDLVLLDLEKPFGLVNEALVLREAALKDLNVKALVVHLQRAFRNNREYG